MSASSAMARSVAFSPKTCARKTSGSAPMTSSSAAIRPRPLRDHAAAFGVALMETHADLAAQADLIVSAVTASQAVPVAAACAPAVKAGSLVSRLQFSLARRKAARGCPDRRRRRTLRRRRCHDIGPAVPHQGALAAGRRRRAGAGAASGRTRLQCQRRERRAWHCVCGQDVPQRHDQGPGGHRDRMFHHGAGLRRRGRGAGVAGGDLSRHRLGKAGRLFFPARHRTWPAPQRRGARGGGDRARDRSHAVAGGRNRRTPGLGRRPRRRGPVRPEGHQGVCPQPRLAHRGGPDSRQAKEQRNERHSDGIPEDPIS